MSPRFGLNVAPAVRDGYDPVALAVRAERLEFDFVSASDHPGGGDASNET